MNKRTKHNLDGYLLTSSEIEELIRERIHSRRDRDILTLRLVDGIGYEKISEMVNLTPTHTKIIAYKRIDELRGFLGELVSI